MSDDDMTPAEFDERAAACEPAELRMRLRRDIARTSTAATTVTYEPGFPDVRGNCPACGKASLFLGAGGYVTCSQSDCPRPDAASGLLLAAWELTRGPTVAEAAATEATRWEKLLRRLAK